MPLYKDVRRKLTDALHKGTWRHGQLLPPEPALAASFDVSVGTLRKAVDELVTEGVLLRRQGRGTFVASHTRDTMLTRFFQIVDREGRKRFPQARMLSFRSGRADAATADLLGLRAGDPVVQVENLLDLDGAPVIYDRIRLSRALFPDMTEEIFSARDSTIYALYQSRYDITVVRIEESITAAVADERVRTLLRLEAPAAVLRIVRTAYAHRDQPVDTRVRFVSTARHRYLSRLGQR